MKVVLEIAANHLRCLMRERNALILLVLTPLVLTLVTGLTFSSPGGSSGYAVPLAVVDLDNSFISAQIVEVLDQAPNQVTLMTESEAREAVANREVSVAVLIPPRLSEDLIDGRDAVLTLLRSDYRESPRMVEQQINRLLFQLRTNAAAANLAAGHAGADWEQSFMLAQSAWQPNPVTVKIQSVTTIRDDVIPTGNAQASPGYTVMFGMMTVIAAGGTSIVVERETGTLSRLLSGPISRFQILAGKTLGLMATGVFQMSLMIIAGRLIFAVNWGTNIPALALVVVALSFAATGIGMLLAAFARTTSQANALGTLSVLVMSMLGGTWWPLEVLPGYMQVIARAVPSGWAMQAFTDLIMRGAGLSEVMIPILALSAFGLGFQVLAILGFRYQN